MWLILLLVIPIIAMLMVVCTNSNKKFKIKKIAIWASVMNLAISLNLWIRFHITELTLRSIGLQYIHNDINLAIGADGMSVNWLVLTALIMPVAIFSNWKTIKENAKGYIIIMLILETFLMAVFLVEDVLSFYIFFESILPPLFVLVGLYGSDNKVRASYYLFLYTLAGSLFLLLSIIAIISIMGCSEYNALLKLNLEYDTQVYLLIGILIAFAIKTPLYGVNSWLLKAHVESPLCGSLVLAGIVLKLSLYGIYRIILPLIGEATYDFTYVIFVLSVITILYASFSTLRTTDIKELIAYSSVGHAAIYLIGSMSNSVLGIQGSIILGIAHGFASSGLFICAGGSLYERTGTRTIYFYRGLAQIMPLFSIMFFILSLANCGTPLTINFVGEFLCLAGIMDRLPVLAILASTSIVFSAAYSIYTFNRISFGGGLSKYLDISLYDLNKREFTLLMLLVLYIVVLGIKPSIIQTGIDYMTINLIN